MIQKKLNLALFSGIVTILFSLIYLSAEFMTIPINGLKDILTISVQWSIITLATFALIHLLAINKYLFAFTFPLLALICSVLSYFRYTANLTLTSTIIDLIFVSDIQTDLELLTIKLVFFVLSSVVFSALAIYFRFRKTVNSNILIHLSISLLLITGFNYIPQFSTGISNRMPYSFYYTMMRYSKERKNLSKKRIKINKNVSCKTDSLTVVLVIGESLRADHLSLNGYHRNTTPRLRKRKNLVSFPNIYSEEIYTHLSIPHILTRADSAHKDLATTEESFISIFKQAGFKSYWLTNQETLENFASFIKECDSVIYKNSGKNDYIFDKWTDDILFKDYRKIVNNKYPKKLIILHCVGSHWWYNSHFPSNFEIYKPITDSKIISNDRKQKIINSYDNTVLFTDYVIDTFISNLENQNSILFYISDHGELLGKYGSYIRTADYPPAHWSAFFVWLSEKYKQNNSNKLQELQKNKDKHLRTDIIFHSVLESAGIKTPFLNKSLSIFSIGQ